MRCPSWVNNSHTCGKVCPKATQYMYVVRQSKHDSYLCQNCCVAFFTEQMLAVENLSYLACSVSLYTTSIKKHSLYIHFPVASIYTGTLPEHLISLFFLHNCQSINQSCKHPQNGQCICSLYIYISTCNDEKQEHTLCPKDKDTKIPTCSMQVWDLAF